MFAKVFKDISLKKSFQILVENEDFFSSTH